MHIIIGNFSNDTIALIQWVISNQLEQVTVLSVDTGWAASHWLGRVKQVESWVKAHALEWQRVSSVGTWADWVLDRQEFPSPKQQWCASMLKGAPLNAWLDEHDPWGEAILLLPKRRAASRLLHDLPETIAESDYYGGRKIWHPLYNCKDDDRDHLLNQAGFDYLPHRSLECDPCIHNSQTDFLRLDNEAVERTKDLEAAIGQPMFCPQDYQQAVGIEQVKAVLMGKRTERPKDHNESFNMGCGSPWCCGE